MTDVIVHDTNVEDVEIKDFHSNSKDNTVKINSIVDNKFSATYEPDKDAFSDNESNETITSTNSNINKSDHHENVILNVGDISNVIKMECDQCEQLFTSRENLFKH